MTDELKEVALQLLVMNQSLSVECDLPKQSVMNFSAEIKRLAELSILEHDKLRSILADMREQLAIATDLGQKRFEENEKLRAENQRLKEVYRVEVKDSDERYSKIYEELESTQADRNVAQANLDDTKAENERLREALMVYADQENWTIQSEDGSLPDIWFGNGAGTSIARMALQEPAP